MIRTWFILRATEPRSDDSERMAGLTPRYLRSGPYQAKVLCALWTSSEQHKSNYSAQEIGRLLGCTYCCHLRRCEVGSVRTPVPEKRGGCVQILARSIVKIPAPRRVNDRTSIQPDKRRQTHRR